MDSVTFTTNQTQFDTASDQNGYGGATKIVIRDHKKIF